MDAKRRQYSAAIQFINGLTNKQFVEFFYEVVQSRRGWEFESEEETESYGEHWVLARVLYSGLEDEPNVGGTWESDIIAPHDKEAYPTGWQENVNLSQEGSCVCGSRLISWATQVICPVCGNKARLT